jgi:hypothetical protein
VSEMTPKEAAEALRRFKFKERMAIFSDTVRPVLLAELARQSPKGKGQGSGRLSRSFRYERRIRATGLQVTIFNTAPYYGYVVRGTKPHIIEPGGNYPLRFFWQKAGGVVSSWGWHGAQYGYVEHPGTKAQPIAKKAWRRVRPVVLEEFKKQIKLFKKEGY